MRAPRPFTPHGYQTIIMEHMLNQPRCAVWAGMGMGKTSSALSVIDALSLVSEEPTLVLAPLRVASKTWPDERAKWEHTWGMSVVPVTGSVRERVAAMHRRADVHAINYENVPWLVEAWGDRWPYRTVIADESTKLKGFRLKQGGVRARALASVAHTKVRRFVELTGTPSPNGLIDLWGQMWFLDQGKRLGRTFSAFKDRWFRPHPSGFGSLPLEHAQREIQELVSDLCITVRAEDWFDIKKPLVVTKYVELPAKVRALYKKFEKEMFVELEQGGALEAFNAASRTIKCLQLASGAVYGDQGAASWHELHDQKLQALDEIIEEAAGMPVLVAYHFKSDLARLQRAFPQGRTLNSDKVVDDWNAGKVPVLFAHPQSAGHGLNLQDGGNILVYFSHWWNLEERSQILERIGPTRQLQAGHNRNVFVYNIVAQGTIDELVLERVESKREVQDILLDAMKRTR